MTYDGPSLSEWLAEYRSRRPATEVVLFQMTLPKPTVSRVSRQEVAALCISRFDDPDSPQPDTGIYLFSLDETGEGVSDTWHEEVQDAFDQAEYEFGVNRSDWTPVTAGE